MKEIEKMSEEYNGYLKEDVHLFKAYSEGFIAGFKSTRKMATERAVAWVGVYHSLTQELIELGESEVNDGKL